MKDKDKEKIIALINYVEDYMNNKEWSDAEFRANFASQLRVDVNNL
jgi:hypothetical protein